MANGVDPNDPVYSDPFFQMAKRQFDVIADYLEISDGQRQRIIYPKRAVSVTIPFHRDDGSVEVLHGYRVQHHLAIGPTKGGTRYAANLTIGECAALSVLMSWKCALTGLPYGGGKGGVRVDPHSLSKRELELVSRRYMQELIPFVGPQMDILGPDMGTNEQVMAWYMDCYSMHAGYAVGEIVTGKPVSLGGVAGRRESTGRGVVFLIERALDHLKIKPSDCTAIIQGYGNVGAVAAQGLAFKSGMKIVGISDHTAAFYNAGGIDIQAADKYVAEHGVLHGFTGGDVVDAGELLTMPCDVLVPAAVEGVITAKNAGQLKCRVLAEAANGPVTPDADEVLNQRWDEVFVIPDILCNSGGVIVSYFEWVQDLQNFFWSDVEIMDRLYRILDTAFTAVIKRSKERKLPHRTAAVSIGVERVMAARQARGIFP
ncbi:Glu/Leu/Phe/Val dehydrogenase dimerization domain-containing protein [soil metagenome]